MKVEGEFNLSFEAHYLKYANDLYDIIIYKKL
jgi:hypothetical protein